MMMKTHKKKIIKKVRLLYKYIYIKILFNRSFCDHLKNFMYLSRTHNLTVDCIGFHGRRIKMTGLLVRNYNVRTIFFVFSTLEKGGRVLCGRRSGL